uniref:Putative phosphate ABC transporter n=1 Tax=Amycolatopsis mediterranei TaxID=33910 RepID=Q1W670_AMYMD|nr:putative phosphate ABC transporter [Amycolatopsis mediterranei]
MKIMRPLSAVGIVASAALVLAACGSDPAATNSSSSNSASAPAATGTADVECGGKSPLSAEGSSAQKNAIDIFTQQYSKKCAGQQVNYNPSGSGAGVKQFNANQIDFGGSDSPIKDADAAAAKARCASDAWNIPLVVGPIAVAYKLSGVDKLTLTPSVTAKIFSGGITKWNDPAIKAVKGNESLNLPDKPIQVVSRADESGTTDNFQKYLGAAAKADWTKGAGKKFNGGVRQRCAGLQWRRDRGEGLRRRHHLRRGRVRQGRPDPRPDRQRLRRRRAQRGERGEVPRRGEVPQRGLQRPRARPQRHLRQQHPGRLPTAADDLRDRLLEVRERGRREGRQGVPDGGRHRRPAAAVRQGLRSDPAVAADQGPDRGQGHLLTWHCD